MIHEQKRVPKILIGCTLLTPCAALFNVLYVTNLLLLEKKLPEPMPQAVEICKAFDSIQKKTVPSREDCVRLFSTYASLLTGPYGQQWRPNFAREENLVIRYSLETLQKEHLSSLQRSSIQRHRVFLYLQRLGPHWAPELYEALQSANQKYENKSANR